MEQLIYSTLPLSVLPQSTFPLISLFESHFEKDAFVLRKQSSFVPIPTFLSIKPLEERERENVVKHLLPQKVLQPKPVRGNSV